ncbi:hypothetical protein [Myroides odoratimimus]|uniref:hypothetical protein n=1 Tax=Myroides odoratimimus TaxID=76832 RepID=UPI0025783C2A|nr:hypothetical protein [Myroides odoratimimus]MDM1086708.1 hypothetical protein [Myroides odoratimimus]
MDTTQYDLDLFFQKGIFKIHVATAGGVLNEELINIEKQDAIRQRALISNINSETELNPHLNKVLEYKQSLINQGGIDYSFETEIYARSFNGFANKDFFSFDRTVVGDSTNNEYHLVAYPRKYDYFITKSSGRLILLIIVKNHLKSILESRKYIQTIKDISAINRHRFYLPFYYYLDEIYYYFEEEIKDDEFHKLYINCFDTYINIKTEDDIKLFMDKVRVLFDSLEFIIELNEKQLEGEGKLGDWLTTKIMVVDNLYNIDN